jgi:hypothetical protein
MVESREDFVIVGGMQIPADFAVEYGWVIDCLAIGGMIGTAANMQRIKGLGITHVLDLQAEFDDSPLGVAAGIEVLWLAVPETWGILPLELIGQAITFATQALAEPANRLFVHCLAGRNRAPLFTYAILRAMNYEHDTSVERIRKAVPRARLENEYLRNIEHFLRAQSGKET